MKLLINDKEINYDKQPNTHTVIEAINEALLKDGHFSHFIADGEEVYENHEQYLDTHLSQLKELQVIVRTEQEFLHDVLLSAEDYLTGAKEELAALPKAFYANPTADTWESFEMLSEGLGWLSEVLVVLEKVEERPVNEAAYSKLQQTLEEELIMLGKAVEQESYQQIGDSIQNGIIPFLHALAKEITTTIDSTDARGNLN